MRADRLLSILFSLQVDQRVTAGELADRLEVSERTIYRDMDALSVAGIPVIAERGIGGGWSLLEEYRSRLTGLNESEIQALFAAMPSNWLSDLGMRGAYESALIKLLASLPSSRRGDAEFTRQRIHIDGAGWFHRAENVSALPIIQEAIWQERQLIITYQRGDETTVERTVDPLGLVAKGSLWYLVAGVAGELRTYRVSRVQSASITAAPCARPDGFDLAAYWEQSKIEFKANLPRYPAVIRALPAVIERLRYTRYSRLQHADPPAPDGWIRAKVDFEVIEEACEFVLTCGAQVEVLEPHELREKVLHIAQSIAALYTHTT